MYYFTSVASQKRCNISRSIRAWRPPQAEFVFTTYMRGRKDVVVENRQRTRGPSVAPHVEKLQPTNALLGSKLLLTLQDLKLKMSFKRDQTWRESSKMGICVEFAERVFLEKTQFLGMSSGGKTRMSG